MNFIAITVFLSLLLFVPPARAETWREVKHRAESFLLTDDYKRATTQYEIALNRVGPQDQNGRAMVEAGLVCALLKRKEVEKAKPYTDDFVKTFNSLKTSRRMDPDVLIAVRELIDGYQGVQFGLEIPYAVRHRKLEECSWRILELMELVESKDPGTIDWKIQCGRNFIGGYQPEKCRQYLLKLLPHLDPHSPQHLRAELYIAAIEEKEGKPERLIRLRQELRKSNSECETVLKVSEAKHWTGHQVEARKDLEKWLAQEQKSAHRSIECEIKLDKLIVATYLDCADYKGAEPVIKHQISLMKKAHKSQDEINPVAHELANCLREQKKFAEADTAEPKRGIAGSPNLEFMLTDEEKEAVRRAKESARRPTPPAPNR